MDAVATARRLADALEAAGIPYAIGGAIAYGYFGPPRGTFDVDVNIFLPPEQAGPGLDALVAAGVWLNRAEALASAVDRGDAKGVCDHLPVDIFFNSIPVHDSAALRTVIVDLLGRPARVLAPEDTAVFKLLFFRGKDLVDLERMLALMGPALDRDYVRTWLVSTVGEDDYRVGKWDELCAALK